MNWSEIIGHSKKIVQLKEMIQTNNFPNAVIFSGLEGIGKKKIAEVVAKSLLCENDSKPCNECQSCHSIENHSHPDYYFIEPDKSKANPIIKIDQIRQIQQEISKMPVMSNCRMILIDDAELMNVATQNCLLKTLEEPTGLTKLILITSSFSRLLMTIRSRCMRINFDKLNEVEIERELERQNIIEAKRISLISNGSLGKAFSLVRNKGLEIREEALNFFESLVEVNLEEIFVKGEELSKQPKDTFKEWTLNIQKFLRDVLLIELKLEDESYYNRDLKNRMMKLHNLLRDEQIYKMMKETVEVQRRLKSNATLELLIESYFIRLRRIMNAKSDRSTL